MDHVKKLAASIGVIPVIKIDDADKAVQLAQALKNGGIPCAEVTFRTADALRAMEKISEKVPDVLLGAGTVLLAEQVDRAIDAGARFIVSPGINPKVVDHCLKRSIPIFPGCVTPTEIEIALGFGLDTVKFFPAQQAGGLDYIKAVSAPYTGMKFIPTGGINLKNLGQYISNPRITACGGSYMATGDMIAGERWDEISDLCRQSLEIVRANRKAG